MVRKRICEFEASCSYRPEAVVAGARGGEERRGEYTGKLGQDYVVGSIAMQQGLESVERDRTGSSEL